MRNQILIGLGGTGGKVLKAFRKRLWLDYPDVNDRNGLPIGFIYVDSTEEMMQQGDRSFMVMGQNTQFSRDEFINIKQGVNLNQILDAPHAYPGLSPIVGNGELMRKTLGNIGQAAGQKRRAGRILFAASCNTFINTLVHKQTNLSAKSGTTNTDIHVFTGLAGGTGSGAILDVVSQIRKLPQFHNPGNTNIMVYAMIPERTIPNGCDVGRYHVNGYAALCELSAFNVGAFLPIDPITGNTIQGIDTTEMNQFGLMLYSNENENNVPAESFKELPELVSNAVYLKMFLNPDPNLDAFRHSFDLENVRVISAEYNSKEGRATERARTKAINSFGIKRIVYPESRILDHLTYTIGIRMLNQMIHNSFDANVGYTDNDNQLGIVFTDDTHLRMWRLDDDRLMLNESLLETDHNFKKRTDFWEEKSEFLDCDSAFEADDPLKELEDYVDDVYTGKFRDTLGVENWYQGRKKNSKMDEQSSYIISLIEQTLFNEWSAGNYSLNNIIEIIDSLNSYITTRRTQLINPHNGDKQQTILKIQGLEKDVKDHRTSRLNRMAMSNKLTGRPVYEAHQNLLKNLYEEKTKLVALDFMDALIVKLQNDLGLLKASIEAFITTMRSAKDSARNKIDDINAMNQNVGIDGSKLYKPIIEIFNVNTMLEYEEQQVVDQATQTQYAGIVRNEIIQKANMRGNHYFNQLGQLNVDDILDILLIRLSREIRNTHDNNQNLPLNRRILGLNVLGQLEQLVQQGNDMARFANEIIRGSGVYLNFDNTEMMKVLQNNPNPVTEPHSMNRKAMIISIPQVQGNNQYKTALRNAFIAAKGPVESNDTLDFTDSLHENEMTIMLVKYLFPARVVSWLQQYHSEYVAMTENANEQIALENRIMLHSEGEGKNLPELMGEPVLPPTAYIPYLFVAGVLGNNGLGNNIFPLLEYGQDTNGHMGWCQVNRDNYGAQFLLRLSEKFTGIILSPTVNRATLDYFKDNVEDYFKSHTIPTEDRKLMCDGVASIVRQYVQKEIINLGSPDYQLYSKAADAAINLIKTL